MKKVLFILVALMTSVPAKPAVGDIFIANANGLNFRCKVLSSNTAMLYGYYSDDFQDLDSESFHSYWSSCLVDYNSGEWEDEDHYQVYCHYAGSVTIPQKVYNADDGQTYSITSIGEYAFGHALGITKISLPNSISTIGCSAFEQCSGLLSIVIPSSAPISSIGATAFSGCTSLSSIKLPDCVTLIGDYAFSGCSNLTSISVESGNTVYDSRNDCNAIINTDTNMLVRGCQNTIIPDDVTIIGSRAFNGCSGLTAITIPKSVTSISECAFADCGLISVTVENTTPPEITSFTFTYRGNITLYVPAGSKAAYEAAWYWNDFKEIKEYAKPVIRGDFNGDGMVNIADVTELVNIILGRE